MAPAPPESLRQLQRPTTRMHLPERDDQSRTKEPGLTREVAMQLAITPQHVGITGLQVHEVRFYGLIDLFREIASEVARLEDSTAYQKVSPCRSR
jgi:hypothetical protein